MHAAAADTVIVGPAVCLQVVCHIPSCCPFQGPFVRSLPRERAAEEVARSLLLVVEGLDGRRGPKIPGEEEGLGHHQNLEWADIPDHFGEVVDSSFLLMKSIQGKKVKSVKVVCRSIDTKLVSCGVSVRGYALSKP